MYSEASSGFERCILSDAVALARQEIPQLVGVLDHVRRHVDRRLAPVVQIDTAPKSSVQAGEAGAKAATHGSRRILLNKSRYV